MNVSKTIGEIDMVYELLVCVSVIQEFICQHDLERDSYKRIASVENVILDLANDYIRSNNGSTSENPFSSIAELVRNTEIVETPNGKLHCHVFP